MNGYQRCIVSQDANTLLRGHLIFLLSSGESRGIPAESCLVSLLWRVASNASGEAVTSQSISHRQSTLATPPQSLRLTLRKRRETRCFSPLESREVHERRGRDKSIDIASSIDFSNASPVVATDPPQEEGNTMFLSSGESRGTRAERP